MVSGGSSPSLLLQRIGGLPHGTRERVPGCKPGAGPGHRERAGRVSLTQPSVTDRARQSGSHTGVWGLHHLSVRQSVCLSPTLQTRPGPYALRRSVVSRTWTLSVPCAWAGRRGQVWAIPGRLGASPSPVQSLLLHPTCAGLCRQQLSSGNYVAQQPESRQGVRAPGPVGLDSQKRGPVPLAIVRAALPQAVPPARLGLPLLCPRPITCHKSPRRPVGQPRPAPRLGEKVHLWQAHHVLKMLQTGL